MNPNPRPGDSGDYWSVPNQIPGSGSPGEWPDIWSRHFPEGKDVVVRSTFTQDAYTLTRHPDGATRSEAEIVSPTEYEYKNVIRIQARNHRFVMRYVVGSGDRVETVGLAGLRVSVMVNGVKIPQF